MPDSEILSQKARSTRYAILIVDDEPSLRDILAQILDGYHVITAEDGRAAITAMGQTSFEMVITDLMMPQVDGFDVLISAKKYNPDMDVLILTGYPTLENESKCRALGCTDVLSKPFAVTVIRSLVEKCARTRSARVAMK